MSSRASQNKPELWIEEDLRLFYAEAITIKATGECFKVEDKLEKIHTYMLDQYNSFRKKGQSFYEDQRDIATKCKCSPKTLGKWMKVLEALGLLVIDESQKSHSYTVKSVVSQEHNLIFSYPKLLNGKPSYDHEEALKRLYTSQRRRNVKNHQPKTEESGKSEQKPFVVQPAAPVVEQTGSLPAVDASDDSDLSGGDDAVNGPAGENVVEFPRQKASFRSVALDDEEFDEDGQPSNKWTDFDLAETCNF